MNKQAPSIGQLITIAGFALACFGLLLFVWSAFGGPTPLAATGYKLKMPMPQINQLAEQSQVKISGVEVGRVSDIQLGQGDQEDVAIVTLEIEPEYAPVPEDTRAILRAKSLIGETYVELAPGNRRDGMLPDGGELSAPQVARSVQLDELFRTFDPETREAFKQGAVDTAIALRGRGATLNQTIGVIPGTLTELTDVLRILNQQENDVRRLVKNTGVVFNALSRRQGQLSGLIRNTNTVFSTTAERSQDLEEFFRVYPTFLRNTRETQTRLGQLSEVGTPIMKKMVPVARQLGPTARASGRLAPVSEKLYTNLKPVIRKAPAGFSSLRGFLDEVAPPLLARLPDYLAELNPIIETGALYKRELTGFLGNAAAALNAGGPYPGRPGGVKFIRAGVTLGPESLSAFNQRLSTNRSSPYGIPGSNEDDLSNATIPVFSDGSCPPAGLNTEFPNWDGDPPSLNETQRAQFEANLRYPILPRPPAPFDPAAYEEQYGDIREFSLAGQSQTNGLPTPGCLQQGLFEPIGDPSRPPTQYQHVYRQQP